MSDRAAACDKHGMWGAFADATADMKSLCRLSKSKWMARVAETAATALEQSQRFYLPNARHVLSNSPASDSLALSATLPFDCISILSETTFDAGTRQEWTTKKISIAFRIGGDFGSRQKLFTMDDRFTFFVFGMAKIHPSQRASMGFDWFPYGGGCSVSYRPGHQYFMSAQVTKDVLDALGPSDDHRFGREMLDDVESVMNLCVLLGLNNVRLEQRAAPKVLQAARARRSKPPLLSYHVLAVDGERWDRSKGPAGTGQGVRSHLRRGHVRRLADDRHIWVRDTVVRGSIPGFVDKDYDLTKAARKQMERKR